MKKLFSDVLILLLDKDVDMDTTLEELYILLSELR